MLVFPLYLDIAVTIQYTRDHINTHPQHLMWYLQDRTLCTKNESVPSPKVKSFVETQKNKDIQLKHIFNIIY